MVLVTSADSSRGIIVKLLGAPHSPPGTKSAGEILRSIERAGKIRAGHPALTRLLDVRWVPGNGFVTLNEYVGGGITPHEVNALPLNRLLAAAIHVLDALDHIHRNESLHGDMCQANILITHAGDAFVLDYDLADQSPELRRTHYPTSLLRPSTLAAWQAADIRAFADVLVVWLTERRGKLATEPSATAEELVAIRRILRRITSYARTSAYDSANRISTEIAHMIRQAA